MKFQPILCVYSLTLTSGLVNRQRQQRSRVSPTVVFAGEGFGKSEGKGEKTTKSYDDGALNPIKDMIDSEAAMNEFFKSNEIWKPVFRSIMANNSDIPAESFVSEIGIDDFQFDETTSPWRRLEAIPAEDGEREVLADFLDNMQQSLIDIPVDELVNEDDNDVKFLEEGRRMLVCSRFHVIDGDEMGLIESHESLFTTCWSEITHLAQEDEADTGSLILVPGYEIEDLRRFTDMNLQRPLQWLGIDGSFEVASLKRGSPAIRLIHKLSDMPTDLPNEPEKP